MDQQEMGRSDSVAGLTRPAVLEELTATQLTELESQFDEGDRQGFDWRAESFGWSREQAQEVWNWFDAGRRAWQSTPEQG
jgi:hypothetical protein